MLWVLGLAESASGLRSMGAVVRGLGEGIDAGMMMSYGWLIERAFLHGE